MTVPTDYTGFRADGATVVGFVGLVSGQRTWRVSCACHATFDMTSAALALVRCKSARDRLKCPDCGRAAKVAGGIQALVNRGQLPARSVDAPKEGSRG